MANSVVINVLAKTKGLNEVESLKAKLTGLTTSKGFQNAVMGVGISAGMAAWNAVGSAVRGTTDYLFDAGKAAADEEAGIARLTTALRENAKGWDGNIDAVEQVINQRQDLAFADDELRTSLALLVGKTKDVSEAFDVQAVAMDLARFKGISLEESSKSLLSALSGQTRVLKQLGINIKSTASQTEILGEVQKVAGGQAAAYAATAQGSFENLSIAMDNLTEDIGKELLPVMVDLARFAKDDLIPAVRDAGDTMGHLNWAMEEQRRLDKDLMFWQRGLLGLWTDSQFSAEAYAEALEEMARQEKANAAWTARLTGATNGLAGGFEDVGDEADDAAESLADLNKRAKDLWDTFIEGTRAATRDEELELEKLPAQIREAQREVRRAQRDLEQARTREQKDEARIRLIEAKQEVNRLQEDLRGLKDKFARTGKVLGYSLGSELHAEVVRWNNLTRRELAALGDIGANKPPKGSNENPDRNALGGTVWGGVPTIVGERGPELFVPSTTGTIVPNGQFGGGGNVAVAVYLDSEQIAARVERRQYFAASVAPVSAR